jgi:hypothetical protein
MEHADLDATDRPRLAALAPLDELMLRRLKKRRLALRDQMARLHGGAVARRACLSPMPGAGGADAGGRPDSPGPGVREAFAIRAACCRGSRPRVFRPPGQTEMALAWRARSSRAGCWWSRPAPASARPFPTWCRPCSAASGSCCPPPPRRCRTSCSAATCRAWCRRWACRCAWRCSRGGAATCACTAWRLGAPGCRRCRTAWPCATLAKVEEWAQVTRTGDLAELPGLDERSPVIPLVTSTRDNCLGALLPQVPRLPRQPGPARGLAADVVVINHHLFFADLAVRESGMAELLPSVRVVVFDEAHQLNETGVQFLGRSWARARCWTSRATCWLPACSRRAACATGRRWRQRPSAPRATASGGGPAAPARLRWRRRPSRAWTRRLAPGAGARCRQACMRRHGALDTVSEMGPDFVRLHERAACWPAAPRQFRRACAPGLVRWVDAANQLRLIESPLDIARRCAARSCVATRRARPTARAWIFTSATLGDDERLRWFTEPCGLRDAEVLRSRARSTTRARPRVCAARIAQARPTRPTAPQVARLAG